MQRAVADLSRLTKHLVGEHIEDRGGRWPLLGAGRREQGIEIDETCHQRAIGGDALAESEGQLALENLRMTLGVDGEVEIGKLGAVGRRLERALQLVEQALVARHDPRWLIVFLSICFRIVPAVGGNIRGAHDDGAVIGGRGAEPGHAAIEQIGGVAIEVAERRLDAEQPSFIGQAGRESELLRAAFEAVIGRHLVGARQRLGIGFAVEAVEGELRHALLGDLDLAAADADEVEQHVFGREGQRHATAAHIAPIAGTVGLEVEAQHRIDDGDFARLDGAAEQRADIEPGLERAHLEERSVETTLLIGNLDVVESELGRRQEHEVNLAADLDLAAEQVGRLRLEDGAIVVPVNEKRRGKQRAQDQKSAMPSK